MTTSGSNIALNIFEQELPEKLSLKGEMHSPSVLLIDFHSPDMHNPAKFFKKLWFGRESLITLRIVSESSRALCPLSGCCLRRHIASLIVPNQEEVMLMISFPNLRTVFRINRHLSCSVVPATLPDCSNAFCWTSYGAFPHLFY